MQIFIDLIKNRLNDDSKVMNQLVDPIDIQARLIEAFRVDDDSKILDALATGVINLLTIAANKSLPLEQMVSEKLCGAKTSAAKILADYRSGKLTNNKNAAKSLQDSINRLRAEANANASKSNKAK
jgi:hypothetical protein